MPLWLGLVILVLAVASRPIEVRLWRAGKLSDRTLTVLLLARIPVLVAIASVSTGVPVLLTVFLVAVSLVVPALLYRFTLGLVREQRVEPNASSRDIAQR